MSAVIQGFGISKLKNSFAFVSRCRNRLSPLLKGGYKSVSWLTKYVSGYELQLVGL